MNICDTEPKVFVECDQCGATIYDGDDYYFINGRYICLSCLAAWAEAYRHTAYVE